jgi:hypothetical protein
VLAQCLWSVTATDHTHENVCVTEWQHMPTPIASQASGCEAEHYASGTHTKDDDVHQHESTGSVKAALAMLDSVSVGASMRSHDTVGYHVAECYSHQMGYLQLASVPQRNACIIQFVRQ